MGYTTVGSGGAPDPYVLSASSAKTATLTTADQSGQGAVGMSLTMNATASASTPGVTPKIQGKSASGIYYDLLIGTQMTGTGTQVLKLAPGIGQVANGAAADRLPAVWRVVCTAIDSDSLTYSLDVELFS